MRTISYFILTAHNNLYLITKAIISKRKRVMNTFPIIEYTTKVTISAINIMRLHSFELVEELSGNSI